MIQGGVSRSSGCLPPAARQLQQPRRGRRASSLNFFLFLRELKRLTSTLAAKLVTGTKFLRVIREGKKKGGREVMGREKGGQQGTRQAHSYLGTMHQRGRVCRR